MPIETNDDGAEVDTGTGAYLDKPNHMSPADREESEAVGEETAKAVEPAEAEDKSVRRSRKK